MNAEHHDSLANRTSHRGLALHKRQALIIGGVLLILFCIVGGYPALIGALLLGVVPVLYSYRAKASSIASLLPLPLGVLGGVPAQALFGAGHLVFRLFLGVAAGAFAGLVLSTMAMTFDMRRDIDGAAA